MHRTAILFQDWLALASGANQLTFHGKIHFENVEAPLEQDNFAFCKVIGQKSDQLVLFSNVIFACAEGKNLEIGLKVKNAQRIVRFT